MCRIYPIKQEIYDNSIDENIENEQDRVWFDKTCYFSWFSSWESLYFR